MSSTSTDPSKTDSSKITSSKTVTLNHVAEDAGVSRSTVSLVLRNSPLVAAVTRARVQASIKRLGYVYNRGAASLRSQQSNTIGLIVTNITNPFFAELTVGVEDGLEESRYTALLGNTSDTLKKQNLLLERMQEHRPDGILLCPTDGTSVAQLRRMQKQTPVVLFVRYLPDLEIDYVGADNVKGGEIATAHLISLGHKRIGFVGGPAYSSARRDRLQGYANELRIAGIPVDERLIVVGPMTREGGRQGILELLNQENPPTAAVCCNDLVAVGAMLGLQSVGQIPGEDFAVVGFDDIDEAQLWHPPLTTVALDPHHLGEMAAHLLLERIAKPKGTPRQITLACRLVVRQSSGGPVTAPKPQ